MKPKIALALLAAPTLAMGRRLRITGIKPRISLSPSWLRPSSRCWSSPARQRPLRFPLATCSSQYQTAW
jgi:hypothetical protein